MFRTRNEEHTSRSPVYIRAPPTSHMHARIVEHLHNVEEFSIHSCLPLNEVLCGPRRSGASHTKLGHSLLGETSGISDEEHGPEDSLLRSYIITFVRPKGRFCYKRREHLRCLHVGFQSVLLRSRSGVTSLIPLCHINSFYEWRS